MYTYYQNIVKLLTHPNIIETADVYNYQNIAKLLTHPNIIEKAHVYVLPKYCKTFDSP